MAGADELMGEIVSRGPMVNRCAEMSYQSSLELERVINPILFESEDSKEGIKAFREKRKYEFKNN